MASPTHEIAVARLSRDPSLLPLLARTLGKPPPGKLRVVDSTVRFVDPAEVRPDLLLARGKRGPWNAIEVQLRKDPQKGRRWSLLVSALNDQRGCMGDLWVLTASKRTAAWALNACSAVGPSGTRLGVKPIVLLLGAKEVEALLENGRQSLAFFAAWAVSHQRGPKAERVIERALEITDGLSNAPLRRQQERDIMGVLNGRLMDKLKEKIMEPRKHFESRWMRRARHEMFADQTAEMIAKGEAKGKREALLMMLEGRGLSMTRAQRAAILRCEDLATLDRWVAGSGKVASAEELLAALGGAPKKSGARARAQARPRNGSARPRAGVGAARAG
jgi:hypothetical protein